MDTPSNAPGPAEIRAGMGIASEGLERRGQKDTAGFASTPEQMSRVWELSGAPPFPERWSDPPGEVIGAICPHDDYILAGRVYRSIIPLVSARTVVVAGVFHGYRRFGVRGSLVFDPYRTWRTPDGDVPVSSLRDVWIDRLGPGDAFQDAAMHDSEHSVEAVVYWLRHAIPDLEIIPVLVPAMPFPRLEELAARAGTALGAVAAERGFALGRDLAVVISADAVHYGADFGHAPFGAGGEEAHALAAARDRALLSDAVAGPISPERVRALYETFVNPDDPDEYRVTWCGRFSIPFGLLMLRAAAAAGARGPKNAGAAAAVGADAPVAFPVAYSTSISRPQLPLSNAGLGLTAPASLDHFVGHAAVAVARLSRRAMPAAAPLDALDTPSPPARVLSNGRHTVLVTGAGSGVSLAGTVAFNPWRADRVEDRDGWFFYVKDAGSGRAWSAGSRPVRTAPNRYAVRAGAGRFEIEREEDGIATLLEVCVAPNLDAEIRRLTVTNLSARDRRLEATSSLEIALNDLAAHRAHPVFSKMFVQTEIASAEGAMLATRRPRAIIEKHPWIVNGLVEDAPAAFDTERDRFIGRGRDATAPAGLETAPAGQSGTVLEPAFWLRTEVRLKPRESAARTFVLGAGATREAALAVLASLRAPGVADGAFAKAADRAGELRRALGSDDDPAYFEALAAAMLYGDPRLRAAPEVIARARGTLVESLERAELSPWRPYAVVDARERADLVPALVRAHAYWHALGLRIDVAVIGGEAAAEPGASGGAMRVAAAGAGAGAAPPIVRLPADLAPAALDAVLVGARLVVRDAWPDLGGAGLPRAGVER